MWRGLIQNDEYGVKKKWQVYLEIWRCLANATFNFWCVQLCCLRAKDVVGFCSASLCSDAFCSGIVFIPFVCGMLSKQHAVHRKRRKWLNFSIRIINCILASFQFGLLKVTNYGVGTVKKPWIRYLIGTGWRIYSTAHSTLLFKMTNKAFKMLASVAFIWSLIKQSAFFICPVFQLVKIVHFTTQGWSGFSVIKYLASS